MKRQKLHKSIYNALRGIGLALRNERNLRIHAVMAAAVLVIAWLIGVERLELLILLFAISLVIVCELMNTALENAVDLFIKEIHPLAGIAKDVAAGAVFVAAINAVVVGIVIFKPYIWKLLSAIF